MVTKNTNPDFKMITWTLVNCGHQAVWVHDGPVLVCEYLQTYKGLESKTDKS